MRKDFENPQEEALEIALETRRKLLSGVEDIIQILRSCLVISENLAKKDDIRWIKSEITGIFDEIPEYRIIDCPELDKNSLKKCKIPFEIKLIYRFATENKNFTYNLENVTVRAIDGWRIIDGATNKCLFFLNSCISELQYGGYVQSFFDKIRQEVDIKLKEVNPEIINEIKSLYVNLKSNNPSDYSKVSLSCRKILKLVADKVFPPQEQKYRTKDGREWEVKDGNFRNRLMCFIDKSTNLRITKSECEMIEKYFMDVIEDAQGGVHKNLSIHEASMIAIHTYLILSEVLNKINN